MKVCQVLWPLSAKILRSVKPFAFYYFLLRFAVNKQFTWWIYQRLGQSNRRAIQSCVLWCIHSVREERDRVYVKYQEGDRD